MIINDKMKVVKIPILTSLTYFSAGWDNAFTAASAPNGFCKIASCCYVER